MANADGLDYDAVRHQQVTASYMETLKSFLSDFDTSKKTVVIVPGIMGSKLRISNSNIDNLDAGFDSTHYRDIWSLSAATYRESYKLEIDDKGHDYQDHVIVQDGSIDGVLLGIVKVRPYDNAVQFFKDHNKNCVLFGYDWRWSPTDLAHYLGEFIKAICSLKGQGTDQITLVGHSLGGLVVKAFLDQTSLDGMPWPGNGVTVGTPFYGAAEALHSIYYGQGDLNDTFKPEKMPSVASSWASTYCLMFLSKDVYAGSGLAASIGAYPITDSKSGADVDPFADSTFARYPSWAIQDRVKEARDVLRSISNPPDASILPRWYNIRSVGVKTPVRYKWTEINGAADYSPEAGQGDQSPICDWELGEGDGTVPSWSAFHSATKLGNQTTLTTPFQHMNLLESAEALLRINSIVEGSATTGVLFSAP